MIKSRPAVAGVYLMINDIPFNPIEEFTILLVDDEAQINDVLTQAAKSEFPQCRFIHCSSFEATQAYLTHLRGWAPRLVLLDMDLKTEQTGLDLLSWIRNHEQYHLLPVMVLSVLDEEQVVREAYKRGANIFTNKPFTYEEWKAYVQHLRMYWFEAANTPKLWVGQPPASGPSSLAPAN